MRVVGVFLELEQYILGGFENEKKNTCMLKTCARNRAEPHTNTPNVSVTGKWNITEHCRNIRGKMEHCKHTITTRLCVENEHC